ncbi:hypothetical protein AgCh_027729 [Apium graveolens]
MGGLTSGAGAGAGGEAFTGAGVCAGEADAWQTLQDMITLKRYRVWQKAQEKIMFKYIELCVDMRRGRFAKDGLIQYRIICQQVNVSSLEEVIKQFMDLSTKKAEEARSQEQALEEALGVDNLEARKSDVELCQW